MSVDHHDQARGKNSPQSRGCRQRQDLTPEPRTLGRGLTLSRGLRAPPIRSLFLEERRRTRIIPDAFSERAVLKLMYPALIRASDTWRRVVISEFELKQLTQLREHLQRRHDERMAPIVKNASRSRISSTQRT